MRKDRRWMTSVVKEAAKTQIVMPWARGERRAKWIAKRADLAGPTAAQA